MGLQLLACWDCGFESCRCPVSLCCEIVCCQVEVSATGRSFVQRSPAKCVVSLSFTITSTPPLSRWQEVRLRKKVNTNPFLPQKNDNYYYIFWVCVCSLSYPACNAREQYCYLWHFQPYSTLTRYLINSKIFEKKAIGHKMCVFIVSKILSETFLIQAVSCEILP